ncbi:MAG: hypothetical protein DRI34_09420 [Deltaproteobacteria bacterium]|nr:MAG: hypothetical protein DRI34_09420 [Deltaproteobacteria bacterium]
MAGERIAIVDDSEIVLAMASTALESAGYTVRTAARWEELDRVIVEFSPGLIIMDINMPEILGDDALAFFKEARQLDDVPILLFSDIDVQELEQRARAAGADGFVSKSWSMERLLEEVGKHLTRPV